MKSVIIFFIKLYQATLSPDHGWLKAKYPYGFCKFYPSCSEYTKQEVARKGVFLGIIRGVIRILKCNPWAKPKIDLGS